LQVNIIWINYRSLDLGYRQAESRSEERQCKNVNTATLELRELGSKTVPQLNSAIGKTGMLSQFPASK
jgi:hypothetical protein